MKASIQEKQGRGELSIMDVPVIKRHAKKYHADYATNKRKIIEEHQQQ